MATFNAIVQNAAGRHASLLQGLQETEAAPVQLLQQNAYIKDLDSQTASTTKRVNDLKKKTAAGLKDHEKYRDSTFRRFAHKARGKESKFTEKAAKEEQEYFDAIQSRKSAEDELAYLEQLKVEANIQREKLEVTAQRHEHLQAELDALHDSVFAGHTPELPDEDQKEHARETARQHVQLLQQRLESERHILFLFGEIVQKLADARNSLNSAYGMSQDDLCSGDTTAPLSKRNHLEKAESSIQVVRMLQEQLKQAAPEISNLGGLKIAMGSIWSDVVFNIVSTDIKMHEQIKDSIQQVNKAGLRCSGIIKKREEDLKKLNEELKTANEGLQSARLELQQAREDAFSKVLAGAQLGAGLGSPPPVDVPSSEAPPTYTPRALAPPGYSA